jgi:hypothetical protein
MTNTRSLGLLSLVVLTTGSLSLAAEGPPRNRPQRNAYLRMSGTYELESTRGDNPQRAADAATRSLPPEQRDRVYQSLINRLEPPATIAIDRNGATVTISSSRGPRATFDADGRTRNEVGPNGRATSTRAEFTGDRLSVSTSGNRGTDFQVTFEPLNNGDGLRITRSLDSEELGRPITVQSYYRRIANEPRWDLYAGGAASGSGNPPAPAYAPPAGDFVVPDGTRLIATLDTPLSTRTSRSGERFTMTVRGPAQFEGARIDGVVSRVNPYRQGSNTADMMVNFETIQLPGGRTSEFRAILNSVRTPDGATLRVDVEGGVRDVTTNDTRIEHGAIGAAVGAIIGAIAGGGKGAAVGAAVGAVVGGTGGAILVEGRDQLDLPPGTEVTITATAPRYR